MEYTIYMATTLLDTVGHMTRISKLLTINVIII